MSSSTSALFALPRSLTFVREKPTTNILLYVLLGLTAGALSGLLGIGGGVIIVPALILFFGLSQHQAQGTTLALLIPPIGILAVWAYYKQGYVNLE